VNAFKEKFINIFGCADWFAECSSIGTNPILNRGEEIYKLMGWIDQPQVQALARINVDDFCTALGVQSLPFLRWPLQRILFPVAYLFARRMASFDRWILETGLAEASEKTLARFVKGLEVCGREYIPASGPLLILSNHPGLTDTIALFAAIRRPDLKIVALDRPFLRALTHTSRHLIFIPEGTEGRIEAVRGISRHLREGGAVLTFPAGHIEPDPAVMPGAVQSLENWSQSIALFVRMVPQALVVPALVSGVVAEGALHHPLLSIRRREEDRERLAATLQIASNVLFPSAWPVRAQVRFGAPLQAGDLAGLGNALAITHAVTARERRLIEEVDPVAVPTIPPLPASPQSA